MQKRLIVTGGCGFIGSNFIHHILKKYPSYKIVNVDKLTYAGNEQNLNSIKHNPNYLLVKEDICNKEAMSNIIQKDDIVVNFAAESHVDNSITDAETFVRTNVLGVQTLLDVARNKNVNLFLQISTDEVYGSLNFEQRSSTEKDPLHPSSPYSASKAAAEMLCMAAVKTFKQPVIITRSSNNFGPYQFPEKVVPLFITNLLEGKKVPLYGEGKNVRDWIYVIDNCEALDFIIHKGEPGEIYNIGGGNELNNVELTNKILHHAGKDNSWISYVPDRLGHDLRYSLDSAKLHALGWKPNTSFDQAFIQSFEWYKNNVGWWKPLKEAIQLRKATK